MEEQPQRGYQIVDPGLGLPATGLNADAQVRCLAYLMKRIREIATVPNGVLFELIPVQYLGGPYPATGLYTEIFVDTDNNLRRLSLDIGDQLGAFIKQIGVERLLELSSGETVRWQDVLQPYEEALRACQDDWRKL